MQISDHMMYFTSYYKPTRCLKYIIPLNQTYIQMCITFFYLNTKPTKSSIKFVIAFNRDESADRETLPFSQFDDDANVYAGKDILSGGSWLGINIKTGIMVILTNYRKIRAKVAKSRGLLVKYFLSTQYLKNAENASSEEISNKIYKDMVTILQKPQQYSAHNISVYNIRDNKIFYMCSEVNMKEPILLPNNTTQGYSNADIGTDWDKVVRGRNMFQAEMEKAIQNDLGNLTIFDNLRKVMKNRQGTNWFWKYFESSIFLDPYYNPLWRCYRKTKSTFYAIFRADESGPILADIRQVSYEGSGKEQTVKMELQI